MCESRVSGDKIINSVIVKVLRLHCPSTQACSLGQQGPRTCTHTHTHTHTHIGSFSRPCFLPPAISAVFLLLLLLIFLFLTRLLFLNCKYVIVLITNM